MEVRCRKKLLIAFRFAGELLSHEDVLLVDGISFTQRQREGGEQVRELVVAVDVCRILLHRILYLQDSGVFARLGVQYAHALRVFNREVDVLEDALAFAARAERIDRHGHAHAKGNEDYENIYNHSAVYN